MQTTMWGGGELCGSLCALHLHYPVLLVSGVPGGTSASEQMNHTDLQPASTSV